MYIIEFNNEHPFHCKLTQQNNNIFSQSIWNGQNPTQTLPPRRLVQQTFILCDDKRLKVGNQSNTSTFTFSDVQAEIEAE